MQSCPRVSQTLSAGEIWGIGAPFLFPYPEIRVRRTCQSIISSRKGSGRKSKLRSSDLSTNPKANDLLIPRATYAHFYSFWTHMPALYYSRNKSRRIWGHPFVLQDSSQWIETLIVIYIRMMSFVNNIFLGAFAGWLARGVSASWPLNSAHSLFWLTSNKAAKPVLAALYSSRPLHFNERTQNTRKLWSSAPLVHAIWPCGCPLVESICCRKVLHVRTLLARAVECVRLCDLARLQIICSWRSQIGLINFRRLDDTSAQYTVMTFAYC